MPNLYDPPSPALIAAAIEKGEGQQVEFRTTIRTGLELAQLICAFANAEGGFVFLGIREPRDVVGCDFAQISNLFDIAVQRVRPLPETSLHEVVYRNATVAVVVIKASLHLVASDAGIYKRQGETVRPMSVEEIAARISADSEDVVDEMAVALNANTKSITELVAEVNRLRSDLRYAQSIRGQLGSYFIGFLLGIVASVIASFVYAFLLRVFGPAG